MAPLVHLETRVDNGAGFALGITDFEVFEIGGQAYLYTANTAGGILAYRIQNGTLVAVDEQAFGPIPFFSTLGATDLSVVEVDGQILLMPLARTGQDFKGFVIGANGQLGAEVTVDLTTTPDAQILGAVVVNVAGQQMVLASLRGRVGLAGYQVGTDPVLTQMPVAGYGADFFAQDVSALRTATIGGQTYVFSGSQGENGLNIYRVESDGSILLRAVFGADQGLGIDTPTALSTVSLGGSEYVILAGGNSSSLSVLRVFGDGQVIATDHVIDDLNSRFQAVVSIATALVGDRVFVAAGGGDDGLSLFTLLPGGRLFLLHSVEDTQALSLANTQAVSLYHLGSKLHVFAAGETEAGVTHFTLNTAALGQTVGGSTGADTLMGGTADDVLAGYDGDDVLNGGGGDDLILDGAGVDEMTGGAGADVFILSADDQTDRIMDFNITEDSLDLSAWPMFYQNAQLGVETTANGAVLTYRDERLEIVSHNGAPLDFDDFAALDIVNLDRPLLLVDQDIRIRLGTAGQDDIVGASGKDIIYSEGGDDYILSEGGPDEVDAGDGDDRVEGGAGRDVLFGGAGKDTLFGGGAKDVLDGGDGADRLVGQGGNDTLIGGTGRDRLFGVAGNDTILAGNANDLLDGGNGNDTMTGGNGNDTFAFKNGFGNDVITDFEGFQPQEVLDLSLVDGITDYADLVANHMVQSGSDVVITDGTDSITLENTLLSDLGSSEFLF